MKIISSIAAVVLLAGPTSGFFAPSPASTGHQCTELAAAAGSRREFAQQVAFLGAGSSILGGIVGIGGPANASVRGENYKPVIKDAYQLLELVRGRDIFVKRKEEDHSMQLQRTQISISISHIQRISVPYSRTLL